MELGAELGEAVEQGEGSWAATNQRAMRAEPFDLGVSAAKKAALEALPFVASVDFFAGGNSLRVVGRRVEVEGADLVEVEHVNQRPWEGRLPQWCVGGFLSER